MEFKVYQEKNWMFRGNYLVQGEFIYGSCIVGRKLVGRSIDLEQLFQSEVVVYVEIVLDGLCF